MKSTRFAVKAFAVTLATTIVVLGSFSAPAQAKDTGWGVSAKGADTGWGISVKGADTGWG